MVRELLYGADATDEMVVAGAEIMHASTVRAFAAFYPALGEHDKREELKALTSVPVEILVGDSDKLTPKRHSRHLAEVAARTPRCTSSSAPDTCSPRSARTWWPMRSGGC